MPSQTNRVDIVMTTFNRIRFTQNSIELINKRTKTPFRLIVVDNNSTDGTQPFLLNMKEKGMVHHVILLEENYGIHMAKNYGLSLVRSSPYYIDTDNDLLCPNLEPDWISALVSLMDKHPSYGAISCRPQVLVGTGEKSFNTPEDVIKFDHVGAHLRIMRTDEVRKVGGWEKTWEAKRNHEDSFIASALNTLGWDVGYARDIRCFHMFGENWGYKDLSLEEHGHRAMWPPSEHWDTLVNKLDTETWREK